MPANVSLKEAIMTARVGQQEERRNFTRRLNKTIEFLSNNPKTAVFQIDMGRAIFECAAKQRQQYMLTCQLEVIKKCQQTKQLFFVIENRGAFGEPLPELSRAICNLDSDKVYRYTKNCDNFFDCERDEAQEAPNILKRWGCETILLMGMNAAVCVKETANGALRHNFKVMTCSLLIGNDTTDMWVENSDEIQLFGWDLPYFRSINALIE